MVALAECGNQGCNVKDHVNNCDEEHKGVNAKGRAESELQHLREGLLSRLHKLLVAHSSQQGLVGKGIVRSFISTAELRSSILVIAVVVVIVVVVIVSESVDVRHCTSF